jgi:hypothetical protein
MPDFHQAMQAVMTLSVGGVALHVILNPKARPELQKWAYTIIGTLIGLWFRG